MRQPPSRGIGLRVATTRLARSAALTSIHVSLCVGARGRWHDGTIRVPLGGYLLAIDLSEPVAVSICGKPSALLAPGLYLYCGSAKGPGGLRARLAHHMRRQANTVAHRSPDGGRNRARSLDVFGRRRMSSGRRPFAPADRDQRLWKHQLPRVYQPPVAIAARRRNPRTFGGVVCV
jgi:hypothetical protein